MNRSRISQSGEPLFIHCDLMCSNRLANVCSNQGRFGGVIDPSWLLELWLVRVGGGGAQWGSAPVEGPQPQMTADVRVEDN